MIGYRLVLRRFDSGRFGGVYVIRSGGGHTRKIQKKLIQRLRKHCEKYLRQGPGLFGPVWQGKLYWVKGNRKAELHMWLELQIYLN